VVPYKLQDSYYAHLKDNEVLFPTVYDTLKFVIGLLSDLSN